MIIDRRDPATMSAQERLFEIAAILARGYLRLLSRKESRKGLDEDAESSAHCNKAVNGNGAVPAVEVA